VWAVLLAIAVALGLCGCSAFGAPATTEELLVRYVANENVNNFGAAVNVDISVNAMGVRAVVPVSAKLRVANNVAHGTIEVDLSSLDTRNYTMEFYAELLDDALNCYIGTPHNTGTSRRGGATWKLWKIDTTSKIDIFTITDLLSSSELTIIAKDSDPLVDYELAVPTAKVLKTAFDVTAGTAELGGMDERGLIDAVGNDKVRVGFTKDCLMRSLSSGVLLTFKSAKTNNVEVRTGVEVSATFDDYGKVDSSEVAIPNDVRDAAVRADAPVDVIEVIGEDSPLAGAVAR
jgi:hypothetical protein